MNKVFNYTIIRLSYLHITGFLFVTGVTVGGFGGITLGLMAGDAVGILGGAFLGLITGIGCALIGLIFTAVFNLLSPYVGGLPVKLDAMPGTETPATNPNSPTDTNVAQDSSA